MEKQPHATETPAAKIEKSPDAMRAVRDRLHTAMGQLSDARTKLDDEISKLHRDLRENDDPVLTQQYEGFRQNKNALDAQCATVQAELHAMLAELAETHISATENSGAVSIAKQMAESLQVSAKERGLQGIRLKNYLDERIRQTVYDLEGLADRRRSKERGEDVTDHDLEDMYPRELTSDDIDVLRETYEGLTARFKQTL